jgi:hydrogenase maturation protease
MADSSPDVVILGIGNVPWADEGFGVRTVEAMNGRYVFSPSVRLVDGGRRASLCWDSCGRGHGY